MERIQKAFLQRFVAACEADDRIEAALIGGSHVKGAADAYSDLDLTIITRPGVHAELRRTLRPWLESLGQLVFLEHFRFENLVFLIYADGVEGELTIAASDDLAHVRPGPFRSLVDKTGMLAGTVFPGEDPDSDEQRESVRQQITWFWHDVSHFLTAIGRGQLWWAYGQLQELRAYVVNLLRLRHDFGAPADGFEKVDKALPPEELARLDASVCACDRAAMLHAGDALVACYRELAIELGRQHGIAYPTALETVMLARRRRLDL